MSRATILAFYSFFLLNWSQTALATVYPMLPFEVSGQIRDWDTKRPLANVQLIVFLNNAVYADNHGWVPNAQDYPNFPSTDENGCFKARTRLYRGTPKIEIYKVEIIGFRDGYRTERFAFENPKFSLSKDRLSGMIEISEIFLLKNREKE